MQDEDGLVNVFYSLFFLFQERIIGHKEIDFASPRDTLTRGQENENDLGFAFWTFARFKSETRGLTLYVRDRGLHT